MAIESVRHVHQLAGQVYRFDIANESADSVKELMERVYDRVDFEVAGGNFMEHWGKKEEVVPGHQRDRNVLAAPQQLFQFQCRVYSAEASPQNQNTAGLATALAVFPIAIIHELHLRNLR
jgi:hypothetical protein